MSIQCLQNIKYWWNGDLRNLVPPEKFSELAHSSQTTVKQKISTECESKCLPNISGLNSAFVGNWRPRVCKNSLQQSKCKLWQKDQMTPTAPRNWMSCPWWGISRITRNLGKSYYQKRPWTTWGTPPSNSRLIFVNCFIHAGFSLIATTLSPRCVYPAQMDTWCTVGWTDNTVNRCALHIIKITTTCHNITPQHNNTTLHQHNQWWFTTTGHVMQLNAIHHHAMQNTT